MWTSKWQHSGTGAGTRTIFARDWNRLVFELGDLTAPYEETVMRISPARLDDLPTLLKFRDDAVRWLKSIGSDQWASPWPTRDRMTKAIKARVEASETFIVWDGGKPAATITIDEWADPDLWTEAEAAEAALYAHQLIVDRAYAGQGLGAELLDWAGDHAARLGKRWLRLDAWSTNATLQRYYQHQDFKHVRTRVLPHNPSGALFQRPVAHTRTRLLSGSPDSLTQ